MSQKSTLTFSPVSTLKSVVDSATGDHNAERLVSKNQPVADILRNDTRPVNTLSIHEPVAKTEASVVTNAISPPDLKDSSSNVIDSNSSSECGHAKVLPSKTVSVDKNQRRRLCEVEENIPSSKKPKIVGSDAKTVESDPIVASMLSDFVDTLQ